MIIIFRFLGFLFLLPLVQTYFFNLAIGHDPKGLNIAVVNEEIHHRRHGECKPEYYQGCFLDYPQDVIMSCAYVETIKSRSLNIVSIFTIFPSNWFLFLLINSFRLLTKYYFMLCSVVSTSFIWTILLSLFLFWIII